MGSAVSEALGVALCRARGGAAGGAPPGLAKGGVERPESGGGWAVFFSAAPIGV